MPSTLRFTQLDVFTDRPLMGNPLAVVHDATGMDPDTIRRFTDWTNLSEATFLAPPTHPDAAYAVRSFSPGRELSFAGHPTLGSCHAWLTAGGTPKGDHIVQECGVGLVRIRRVAASGPLAFAAPPPRQRALTEAELDTIVRCLGVTRDDIVRQALCANGPEWRVVMLRSAADVLALRPDGSQLGGLDIGVVGPHVPGGEARFEVRSFFPGSAGMMEIRSPAASIPGSVSGSSVRGPAPDRYVAAPGTAMGRAGRIFVERDGDDVWVGGHSVGVIEGTVSL